MRFSDPGPVVGADPESLLEGATERVVVRNSDAKSGSYFERVVIDGQRFFFKTLSYDVDWISRVTGDVDHRQFKVWRAGLYQRFPASVDHTIVAMAVDDRRPWPRLGILMHDVGEWLIPEGDDHVSEETHLDLVEDMARLHAGLWGFRDELGLTPTSHRFRFFARDVLAPELALDEPSPVVRIAADGWQRLQERRPSLAELVFAVHDRPEPLGAAMNATPSTLVTGDWKMGNLGRHADGRSIVLDQAYPGAGPGTWDLAWYLALNRARMPIGKEDTIEHYRASLERAGVSTAGWFTEQLELCLFATIVCFGWEKAYGDDGELDWWGERAEIGRRRLAGAWPA